MEDILEGRSEQEKVLVSSPEFMILPDMKWDLKTISSLYLVAIAQDRSIRSLRDLRKRHLSLLKNIYSEAERIVHQRWGLGKGSLRMFVHYQPSYCTLSMYPLSFICTYYGSLDHFHVHIVNVNCDGLLGMSVGQAHLLDDLIMLVCTSSFCMALIHPAQLELSQDESIFEKTTFTYGLGDQHGLYEAMKAAST